MLGGGTRRSWARPQIRPSCCETHRQGICGFWKCPTLTVVHFHGPAVLNACWLCDSITIMGADIVAGGWEGFSGSAPAPSRGPISAKEGSMSLSTSHVMWCEKIWWFTTSQLGFFILLCHFCPFLEGAPVSGFTVHKFHLCSPNKKK